MDGCWEPWLKGCAVDWQAWGAIFTLLAAIVALALGLQASQAEGRRRKALLGVYASGMQLRLKQLVDQLDQLAGLCGAYGGMDPSPAQAEGVAVAATHPRALFGREEIERVAAVDTELAGIMSAVMEGVHLVAGYIRDVQIHHSKLSNLERMRKMALASKLADETSGHARKAQALCEKAVSHRFVLPNQRE